MINGVRFALESHDAFPHNPVRSGPLADALSKEANSVNEVRQRVKHHMPAVLLTLLSIVQALALELIWSRGTELAYLDQPGWVAALLWAQMAANLIGVIVIWVVYVSTVMRFSWFPTISDSVYPFVIGIGEFVLVETTRPGTLGFWFLQMAVVFALMNWVSHHTFRRARAEPENDWHFRGTPRARLRDFYPAIAVVMTLGVGGLAFLVFDLHPAIGLFAVLVVNLLLLAQLRAAKGFWERSLGTNG